MANINIAGKCVLITGGATGLGAGMVKAFHDAGASGIIVDYKSPESLMENWIFLQCDLTDQDAVSKAFTSVPSELKPIDILVANAGIVPNWSSIGETSLQVWDQVMAVNSRGLFLTLKYGFDLLRKPGGAVVVTASINAWKGDGNIIPYVASKHAALGIVRSAALDFGKFGIRVNALGPGPIATDALLSRISTRVKNSDGTLETVIEALEKQTALGRLATIEDVANTALFLCSDMANGITGQIINVDAGLL
jgi:NAD(P)-dependent dehydrogenase (short-subunit alcohol dehydrogenase family)